MQNLLKGNQPLAAGRTMLAAVLCNSFYSLTRTNSLILWYGNSSFVNIHRALGLFVLGLKLYKACHLLFLCSIFTHHAKSKELQITFLTAKDSEDFKKYLLISFPVNLVNLFIHSGNGQARNQEVCFLYKFFPGIYSKVLQSFF